MRNHDLLYTLISAALVKEGTDLPQPASKPADLTPGASLKDNAAQFSQKVMPTLQKGVANMMPGIASRMAGQFGPPGAGMASDPRRVK